MAKLKIKGHEFNEIIARDSFNRRSVQYRNKIVDALRKIGLTEDDINIEVEGQAMKKAPAYATWYFEGYHLHYSYGGSNRFVDNLYVVFKIIDLEINALLSGKRAINEFISEFSEDKDIKEQRKAAREALGVSHDAIDMGLIDNQYKELAKKHHPDMPEGDIEKFKAINRAHKILRRELQ